MRGVPCLAKNLHNAVPEAAEVAPKMSQVICIEPDGDRVAVDVAAGDTVMHGAMMEGVEGIEAQCGGLCVCATCHCYVDEAFLSKFPPPSSDELLMLANVTAERRPNSRLSCQLFVGPDHEGLTVTFPDQQR